MSMLTIWLFLMFYFWDKFFFLIILMEGIMMILFIMISLISSNWYISYEMIFLFLSLMVMEGVMGLAIIIMMVFISGNDKFFMSSFF